MTSSKAEVLLPEEEFKKLRSLDTCTVSNAIETFKVRLRNEGFGDGSIHCRFPHFPPMLGYAVTGRIRSSSAPMRGACYYDRMDFWSHVLTVPAPRVIVLEDADPMPGIGALVGEIHARIGLALNCVGYVTNGSVRDLGPVETTGFHLFSGSVSVSHAYAHIVEFGEPAKVGGLKFRSGDLVHGDRNGLHIVPLSIAGELPTVAARLMEQERELIALCQSADFTLDRLAGMFQKLRQLQPCD
jgi:regulator of RNase E activity RraA